MEGVEMAETKLTITKEQAEAFANWKKEYRADIEFAKIILEQELGEQCSKSKLYAMLGSMEDIIKTLEVREGSASVYGKEIASDMQFGVEVARYFSRWTKTLSNYIEKVTPELLSRLFGERSEKMFEIFNLKM